MSVEPFDIRTGTETFVSVVVDSDDTVLIPENINVFAAIFHRSGHDLAIDVKDSPSVVVPQYFASSKTADLVASNGAVLRSDLVELLAGPVAPAQYAQAGIDNRVEPDWAG